MLAPKVQACSSQQIQLYPLQGSAAVLLSLAFQLGSTALIYLVLFERNPLEVIYLVLFERNPLEVCQPFLHASGGAGLHPHPTARRCRDESRLNPRVVAAAGN